MQTNAQLSLAVAAFLLRRTQQQPPRRRRRLLAHRSECPLCLERRCCIQFRPAGPSCGAALSNNNKASRQVGSAGPRGRFILGRAQPEGSQTARMKLQDWPNNTAPEYTSISGGLSRVAVAKGCVITPSQEVASSANAYSNLAKSMRYNLSVARAKQIRLSYKALRWLAHQVSPTRALPAAQCEPNRGGRGRRVNERTLQAAICFPLIERFTTLAIVLVLSGLFAHTLIANCSHVASF